MNHEADQNRGHAGAGGYDGRTGTGGYEVRTGEREAAGGSSSSHLGAALARGALALAGGIVGFLVGRLLVDRGLLSGPNNVLFITVVGVLSAYLFGGPLAERFGHVWERFMARVSGVRPDAVLAAFAGATLGLLVTVLINNVLANVPGFTWYWSLLAAIVLVAGMGGFFVTNRRLLYFLPAADGKRVGAGAGAANDKVVDSSAVIDGRLLAVLDSNFLEGKLILPHFVLTELQHIADSDDQLKRQRGRRGLETLDLLASSPGVVTEVAHDDVGKGVVDDKLVRLCLERNADLITTDYNLSRVAALQGVRVLNLHQLASAVRIAYLPGERLALSIVRQGRESGQGLAYLEDGTMVVVEEAGDRVGHTIDVVVTSSLQTNMGRMLFAKPSDESTLLDKTP
ncbi:MAG: hypothetical protein WC972_00140 [Trueperaceae bacterium]|nr:hypothetical protein [Trueperaceae bacterium]